MELGNSTKKPRPIIETYTVYASAEIRIFPVLKKVWDSDVTSKNERSEVWTILAWLDLRPFPGVKDAVGTEHRKAL
jgi:hypothetical protein